MKLRNKKTGEIGDLTKWWNRKNRNINGVGVYVSPDKPLNKYNSLAELNKEWEDYEEPKDNNYWYIDDFGQIQFSSKVLDEVEEHPNNWIARKLFSNYFETREKAEKAIEKLKAWKRLKDKGFRFVGGYGGSRMIYFRIDSLDKEGDCLPHFVDDDMANDLDLLFGGEE